MQIVQKTLIKVTNLINEMSPSQRQYSEKVISNFVMFRSTISTIIFTL